MLRWLALATGLSASAGVFGQAGGLGEPVFVDMPMNATIAVGAMDTQTLTLGEDDGNTIFIAASSDNTTAIPNDNITYDMQSCVAATDGMGGFNCDIMVTVSPAATAAMPVTITLTICDGSVVQGNPDVCLGSNSMANFMVTVTGGADQMPVANNDTFDILEDSGTLMGDVTIANGAGGMPDDLGDEPSTIMLGTNVSNGTLNLMNDGMFTYDPDMDFPGPTDSFTYTIMDNDGDVSGAATVTINITPVNDAPSFMLAGNQMADEGDPLQTVMNFVTMASPGPNEAGQTLTPSISNDNAGIFSVEPAITNFNQGAGTADLTYTPSADTPGGMATVTVTFMDDGGTANGGDNETSMNFTITINNVNQAPTANPDMFSVNEDVNNASLDVLANDSDPEDGTPPTGGTIQITQMPMNGSANVMGGVIRYSPTDDYFGPDSLMYTYTDSGGTPSAAALVSITVDPINDPPAFDANLTNQIDGDASTPANGATQTVMITGCTSGNSFEDNNGEMAVLSTMVTNSTLNFAPGQDPAITSQCDETTGMAALTYATQNANEYGSAFVTVSVEDSPQMLAGNMDSFNIVANEGPTASDDALSVAEDGMINGGSVFANNGSGADDVGSEGDVDPSTGGIDLDSLQVVSVTTTVGGGVPQAVTGPLMFTPDIVSGITGADAGMVTIDTDGSISYSPGMDEVGSVSFDYTVRDLAGIDPNNTTGAAGTSTATVTITITEVNDPPIANNDVLMEPPAYDEDDPLFTIMAANLLGNDERGGGMDESSQTLAIDSVTSGMGGTAALNGGDVDFTPAADFFGTATFTYTITDDGTTNGGADPQTSGSATVMFTINAVPDAADDGSMGMPLQDVVVGTPTATVIPGVLGNDELEGGVPMPGTVVAFGRDTDADGIPDDPSPNSTSGVISYNATSGEFTFQSNLGGLTGVDSFDYTIEGSNGRRDTARVFVNRVSNINPMAVPDMGAGYTTPEGTTLMPSGNFLGNDTLGNTPATYSIDTGATTGMVVDNMDGTVNYTPFGDNVGSDQFDYTITDLDGQMSTATVTLTITEVNDPPVAVADNMIMVVLEDAATFQIAGSTLTGNDLPGGGIDEAGQTLTVASVTPGAGGTPVLNGGNVDFTLTPDFFGTASFSYTVMDDGTTNGGADPLTSMMSATVTFTVTNVNDPPTFDPAMLPDQTVLNSAGLQTVMDFITNASAGPGGEMDTLMISTMVSSSTPFTVDPSVSLDMDGTGDLTYTPDPAETGMVTVTVTLSDNGGTANGGMDSTQKTFMIDVQPDLVPAPMDDMFTIKEDTVLTDTVATNDMEVGNIPVVFAKETDPMNGVVTMMPDGSFTYTPTLDYFNVPPGGMEDLFTYSITDADSDMQIATVRINVESVPDARADMVTALEDQAVLSIDVLANDEVDGAEPPAPAVISFFDVTTVRGGTVTFNAGTFDYTPPADDSFLDFPAGDQDDSFTYTIIDNSGSDSDTGMVTITIDPVPDPEDDAFMVTGGEMVSGNVLNDNGSGSDEVGNGFGMVNLVNDVGMGVLNLMGDGSFTYDANEMGMPVAGPAMVTFTYTVTDNDAMNPDTSAEATVTITIGEDLMPVARDDSFVVPDGGALPGGGDVSMDNGSGADSVGNAPATYAVVMGMGPSNAAAFMFNSDGTFTYTHDGMSSMADTFVYEITDADGDTDTATVTLNLDPVPMPTDDEYTIDVDETLMDNVITNTNPNGADVSDDPLAAMDAVTVVSMPNNAMTFNMNRDTGAFTYVPTMGFNGMDSFTYTLTDVDNDVSAEATVTITVEPIPNPVGDTINVDEDITVMGNVAADNGSGADDLGSCAMASDCTFNLTTGTMSGNLMLNQNNGDFSYTTSLNSTADDWFEYSITDSNGDLSPNVARVDLIVNAIPDAQNDTFVTQEDIGFAGDVKADNGSGVDDSEDTPATYPLLSGPTVTMITSGPNDPGMLNYNPADGTFSYTPALDFVGQVQFTYRIDDDDGDQSNTATATISVTRVNDPPTAFNDSTTTNEDNLVVLNVVNNDTDSDPEDNPVNANLTVQSVSFPANSMDADNVTFAGTNITYDPMGQFEFLDVSESQIQVFFYTVEDSEGATNNRDPICDSFPTFFTFCGSVTVTINGVNDAPTTTDTIYSVDEDGTLDSQALGMPLNANDVDGEPVRYVLEVGPTNGSLTGFNGSNGHFVYEPDPGYSGPDSFTFSVHDCPSGNPDTNPGPDCQASNVSTAIITVNNVDPPVAVNDSGLGYQTSEDTALITGNVLFNDTVNSMTPPDPLSITAFDSTSFAGGMVSHRGDGTFDYDPPPDFAGVDVFTYTISDVSDSDTAAVSIQVNPVNDAPAFDIDGDINHAANVRGAQTIIGFASNFVFGPTGLPVGAGDESGQTVLEFIEAVSSDPNSILSGTPTVANDGTLSYDLAGRAGTATIDLILRDNGDTANGGDDTSDLVQFTITVNSGLDLAITKASDREILEEEEMVTYTLTVRNDGNQTATGARVTDTLPPVFDVPSATWTCVPPMGSTGTCNAAMGGGNINQLVNLPGGQSVVFQLTATLLPGTNGLDVTNTATVIAPMGQIDIEPANDTDSVMNPVGDSLFSDSFENLTRGSTKMAPGNDHAVLDLGSEALSGVVGLDIVDVAQVYAADGQRIGVLQARSLRGLPQVRLALRGADGFYRLTHWVDGPEAGGIWELMKFADGPGLHLESTLLDAGRTLLMQDNR